MAGGDLFAPEGGFRVRIKDNSGGAEDGIVEEIGGFPTLMQANAFARRYVRDSIERCRAPGMTVGDVLDAWRAFGEDAEVIGAEQGGWQSDADVADFAERRPDSEERNWRALDPRFIGDADPDGDETAPTDDDEA